MNRLAIFALFAVLLTAGCMGVMENGYGMGYEEQSVGAKGLASAPAPMMASDYAGGGSYVTQTSYITVKVTEGTLESGFTDLQGKLRSEGAEMSDIRYNEYGDRKQYTLTVKVLPARFDRVNSLVKDAGEVKSMSVQLEDVTEQYTDLDTRIRNRETELQRLYELYNRSQKVSDLLDVESEMTRVETELELLKGQKQRLLSKVEKSTISITMYEDKPASQQLTNPLENVGQLFFGAMAAAVTILVVFAGFLLPVGAVVGLLWFGYKKVFGKRKEAKPRQPEHSRIPPQQ